MCRTPKPITPEQRARINAIIDFWYPKGWDRMSTTNDEQFWGKWFNITEPEKYDREIKENFMKDYENYIAGDYTGWPLDRDGRLAAILLLDQFTRNMFRKNARAFESDHRALAISKKIVNDEKVFNEYAIYEKAFILLPFEHSENGSNTRRCVTEFMKMDRETQDKMPKIYSGGTNKYI